MNQPSRPQHDILTSRQAVNLFLAGQGSGKSHCAGILSAIFISNFPNVRGLIAANTYDQLNRSTMFRVREVWAHDFGMHEWSDKRTNGCYVIGKRPPAHFNTEGHNFDRYDNIISFDNGMIVYIGSLDNYKALDGMEVGWALLDETKDTKEEAVKEVITGRLRQKGIWVNAKGELVKDEEGCTPFNPLYIFTSPANVPWINEWFFLNDFEPEIRAKIFSQKDYFKKKISNKFAVISSTYHNGHNLPENYIENQKANLHTSLQDMLIYGCPFSKAGGEFYKCYDRGKTYSDGKKMIGKYPYRADLALHVSWDENVHPYLPMGIYQGAGRDLYKIGEIAGVTPNNTVDAVCNEFIRRFNNHESGLFIYGDATSRKEDVKQEKGYDFYRIIQQKLAKYKPQLRVSNSNPSVVMRGNFINTVLEKELYGCRYFCDEGCTKTITDYAMVKEARDGTKDKSTVKDSKTGITYQPYGHFTDEGDYIMCVYWEAEYQKYQKGGQEYKPVYSRPTHARV